MVVAAVLIGIAVPGCAAVSAAIPLVAAITADALAILAGIDAVVSEHFRRHPDISLEVRQTYVQLHQAATRSLRALQMAADGAKSLDDGDVKKAFDEFERAFNELKGWLFEQRLMDSQNQLLLDGQVVSQPVPEAKALLR